MAFIDRILYKPSYGWQDDDGSLVVPTKKTLFKEALRKINIFESKKNWLSFSGVLMIICMLPFFWLFVTQYLSITTAVVFVVFSMAIMSTHGTIWHHRYCTHKAYVFSHPVWRFITQNLVIRTITAEIYAVSHHVHHLRSDKPGDPYNARAGFWYCMLAEFNHQPINRNLDEEEYEKLKRYMTHTGVKLNSYEQYKKWGSLTSPWYHYGMWMLNWSFWFSAFYLIGGMALVSATFSAAMFWYVLVRAFNYTGHGKGKDLHKDGIDYDRRNLSINQTRPGVLTGEWHNNHHLYPNSARAGFLPYQFDPAWIYIYTLYKLGAVSSYNDSKEDFMERYVKNNVYKRSHKQNVKKEEREVEKEVIV